MSKQNNKGLQRFTDFDSLRTVEEFTELSILDNDKFLELFVWLQDKLNEALKKEKPEDGEIDRYFTRLEKILPIAYPDRSPEDKAEVMVNLKRDRWYVNDNLIKEYINSELTKNRGLPTNTQISTATGLSRVTIDKHLKENGASIQKAEELDKFKLLNSIAISRLYKIGMTENNTKALKMFIDYTGEPKKTVINNNYIQINNTRIDSLLIDQLPDETRNQIEALILNNTLKAS
jgi:hypothetical protein